MRQKFEFAVSSVFSIRLHLTKATQCVLCFNLFSVVSIAVEQQYFNTRPAQKESKKQSKHCSLASTTTHRYCVYAVQDIYCLVLVQLICVECLTLSTREATHESVCVSPRRH